MSVLEEKGAFPDLPRPKENVWRPDKGPILPVPAIIKPTLSKYRIEVGQENYPRFKKIGDKYRVTGHRKLRFVIVHRNLHSS